MAQHSLVIASVADLTELDLIGDPSSQSLTFVTDGGEPAVEYLKSHDSHAAAVLNAVAASSEIRAYIRWRQASTAGSDARQAGITISANATEGYSWGGREYTTRRLSESAASLTLLQSYSSMPSASSYIWTYFERVGGIISIVEWSGAIGDKPGTYDAVYDDSASELGAGRVGLWGRAAFSSQSVLATEFHVGTDGDDPIASAEPDTHFSPLQLLNF